MGTIFLVSQGLVVLWVVLRWRRGRVLPHWVQAVEKRNPTTPPSPPLPWSDEASARLMADLMQPTPRWGRITTQPLTGTDAEIATQLIAETHIPRGSKK